ncbi:Bcr/CflA subfamily drug resistance transporter [Pedobacter cryoconitis]|uniref:Bcr/CflA subfamily drug resistance transporter n=1 Tax=Pedobacter cryoconitis TaxID=188932 RepID=A0A7W8ZQ31_9SPHI|nr:multidrug effflux MFS transporter [Pedobacter cryoconitis]MBB5638114.1 Bcr/CflA subfamily drug resistance transporter [Pedobacter cryoconitis]
MTTKPKLWLMIILMMFPQFVETIYSPVLPQIAKKFSVNDQQASQTIAIYFIAFAIGVVFWGIVSDRIGRRKAMIYGLITYGAGTIIALFTTDFNIILLARVIAAFGVAVCSVVTQTILRDTFDKTELAKVFSIMGIALSISPVAGLLTGGLVSAHYGYSGVFSTLLMLAIALITATFVFLPETQKTSANETRFIDVLKKMSTDKMIWYSVFLVAAFNVMLFSYYALAPFIFERAGYNTTQFGYSGIALAIGSFIGGITNKNLVRAGYSSAKLILSAALLAASGALGVWFLQKDIWFLLSMLFIVAAFGIAIPNILSQALNRYKQVAGTAGALFGLMYYLIIGIGLIISGWVQNLGLILIICSAFSIGVALKYKARAIL